jgi:hypothetical protein
MARFGRRGFRTTPGPSIVEGINPKKQRRSLSVPRESKQIWGKAKKETPCLFLHKLPLELRLLVYREVISSWGWGERLHISQDRISIYRNLYPMSCVGCKYTRDEDLPGKWHSDGVDADRQEWFRYRHRFCLRENGGHDISPPRRPRKEMYISLFLSCRTM